MSEEEQSTANTLEVSMEAIYYKEKDDDPSPSLEEGNDDNREYNIATRDWLGGCTHDKKTNPFTSDTALAGYAYMFYLDQK